ncbi:MAG: hypothetical protein VKP57_06610 [Candidatus Sericytochromatia bacterium]|nr:hypothetical protein [Candidatus Sericytochromatia bacterium]
MSAFLEIIGWYNLLGSLFLLAMLHPAVANTLLHAWTRILANPWQHPPLGRLWLAWAGACNLCLGYLMVRAASWPDAVQHDVVAGTTGVYALMVVVLMVGGRGPAFGAGIPVVYALWLAQMAWGLWALLG